MPRNGQRPMDLVRGTQDVVPHHPPHQLAPPPWPEHLGPVIKVFSGHNPLPSFCPDSINHSSHRSPCLDRGQVDGTQLTGFKLSNLSRKWFHVEIIMKIKKLYILFITFFLWWLIFKTINYVKTNSLHRTRTSSCQVWSMGYGYA